MPTIRTLLDSLDLDWSKAAGWDPTGLQVGDPAQAVGRVGVCHDVTSEVIEEAEATGVDLLVSYHPVLFDPTRAFVAGPYGAGLAYRAARAGIAVACVHTAFDAAPGGTADALADALGLSDVAGFGPMWGGDSAKVATFVPEAAADRVADAMYAAGAGSIGRYVGCSFRSDGIGTFTASSSASPAVGDPGATTRVAESRIEMVVPSGAIDAVVAALVAAHPYEEPAYNVVARRGEAGFAGRIGGWSGDLSDLAALVAERLGVAARVAGDGARTITTVGVVPGSGASLLDMAAAAGADAVVTGDVRHHDARRARARGLAVVDAGHAATERPGVARLYAAVASRWDDTVDLTGVDPDPWTA